MLSWVIAATRRSPTMTKVHFAAVLVDPAQKDCSFPIDDLIIYHGGKAIAAWLHTFIRLISDEVFAMKGAISFCQGLKRVPLAAVARTSMVDG